MRDTLNYWSSRCELAEENLKLSEDKVCELTHEMGHLCNEEDAKEHWGLVDGNELDRAKEEIKKLQEYKDLEKDILVSDVNEKQDKISLLEAENKKLKEDLEQQRKETFWRMCESYNGFHKNTNLRDPDWLGEMYAAIEDRAEEHDGTVEELYAGYVEWVGGPQSEEEEEEDEE